MSTFVATIIIMFIILILIIIIIIIIIMVIIIISIIIAAAAVVVAVRNTWKLGGRPSLLHLLYSLNSENPIFHPPHHHHNYNDMTCGVLLFLTVRTRLE